VVKSGQSLIPDKCGRCGSKLRPVWGDGRAALKCAVTDCEWEMSAQEYAQALHEMETEQPKSGEQ